jgi:hypothetical protein
MITPTKTQSLASLDHDLACAIALGLADHALVRVTADALTLLDERTAVRHQECGWLSGSDPLKAATRRFLEARQAASRAAAPRGPGAWSAAAGTKAREAAQRQAIEARDEARRILTERDFPGRARAIGLTILDR